MFLEMVAPGLQKINRNRTHANVALGRVSISDDAQMFLPDLPFSGSDAIGPMRNRDKQPTRRVDVREPLEKFSLLSLKKATAAKRPGGTGDKDARAIPPAKWM